MEEALHLTRILSSHPQATAQGCQSHFQRSGPQGGKEPINLAFYSGLKPVRAVSALCKPLPDHTKPEGPGDRQQRQGGSTMNSVQRGGLHGRAAAVLLCSRRAGAHGEVSSVKTSQRGRTIHCKDRPAVVNLGRGV